MDLFSQKTIKSLLKNANAKPIKYLGQNFLCNRSDLLKIIEASELKSTDTILEIGPGLGTLTIALAKKVRQVIAVEKDKKMVEILKNVLRSQNIKNVKVICEDILKIQNSKFKIQNYKLVANLPYYITAPIIRMFLEAECPPETMVLMVQKEVGERICAKPPRMSKLAVFCQFYSDVKIIAPVLKKSFWPQPKVDSVIIKLTTRPVLSTRTGLVVDEFSKIVKAGFSQPRKQLANNLSTGLNLKKETIIQWLMKNNIKPSQRAETLSVDNWICLAKSLR